MTRLFALAFLAVHAFFTAAVALTVVGVGEVEPHEAVATYCLVALYWVSLVWAGVVMVKRQ